MKSLEIALRSTVKERLAQAFDKWSRTVFVDPATSPEDQVLATKEIDDLSRTLTNVFQYYSTELGNGLTGDSLLDLRSTVCHASRSPFKFSISYELVFLLLGQRAMTVLADLEFHVDYQGSYWNPQIGSWVFRNPGEIHLRVHE